MSSTFVIVLTTLPVDGDPVSVARRLVDERLAACVNILPPMQSVYRWEGSVEQASECQIVVKTTADRLEELKARIAQLHPHDVPEVLVVPVIDGGESYLRWIAASVKGD